MTKISPQDSSAAKLYPNYPVLLSHPDHLYVVGRLHGLRPSSIDNARVLELGCGAGGNILPIASTMPGGQFLAIDQSEQKGEMAKAAAIASGLENINFLVCEDLMALERMEASAFDYIILRDLYSAVPLDMQTALLPICGRLLSESGILYVRYNTYPGWHGRDLLRAFMLRAAFGADTPGQRVSVARRALDDLIVAYAQTGDAYAKLLEDEKAKINSMHDDILMRDLTDVENHPVYVDNFLALADEANLQFISEANMAASRVENYSPEARRQLSLIKDIVQREQRIDFILNRSIRQTLLCKSGKTVQRHVDPIWLAEFYLASSLRPMGPDLDGESGEAFFGTPDGQRIGLTAPKAIAALNHLAVAWPNFIPAIDLAEIVGDSAIVAQLSIDLYPRNWIDLLPRQPPFIKTPGQFPMTTELARWQIAQGEEVTDLRHRNIAITDKFTRQLFPLLNGQNDRQNLVAAASEFDRGSGLSVENGEPEFKLNAVLSQLAECCLLVQ